MSSLDLGQRELRVAPVMTGGTSLSVWMGGATVELYAMLREGEGEGAGDDPGAPASIYRRLCGLTRTTPVVDVITGTSAGGLNGTLLAAGVAYHVPLQLFQELRSTWMDVADLAGLMRDPSSDDPPPSLLNGKDKFQAKVADVITKWREHADPQVLREPHFVDLVTTYTCIQPREQVSVDDFGEEMSEVSFAGTLRFTRDDFIDTGEMPSVVDKLAHAAKASASLPGVFEPSQLSWWDDASEGSDPYDRPNMFGNIVTEKAPIGSQFVVDGGVVVNMPLTEALERIYGRPNDTLVRRVVLYVSPTPKVAIRTHTRNRHAGCADPDPVAQRRRGSATDDAAVVRGLTSPKLREAVATVVTAPRAEGISTDLSDIEQHNRDVRQQRTTRSTLGWLLSDGRDPLSPSTTTPAERELMGLYRDARAEDSISLLFERLRAVVGARVPVDPKLVRESLVRARREQLPATLSRSALHEGSWDWGVAPVEESVSLLSSIINRVLGLPLTGAPGSPSDEELSRTHALLGACKADLRQVSDRCREIRAYDDTFWALRLAELVSQDERALDIESFARAGFATWPTLSAAESGAGPVTRDEVLGQLRAAFLSVAETVHRIHPLVMPLLGADGADHAEGGLAGWREETRQEAAALVRELAAIRSDDSVELIGWGLLRLHVMQTVMIGRSQRREQRVEMLQVSWNTPDHVTGRPPEAKLVGPELARLGAFLKPSWRANDFFWGRMDAAPRLLELLVDPRRLVQLGIGRDELCDQLGVSPDPQLVKELAFLDDPAGSIPHRLPRLVELLGRRRQLEIAREELPHIAGTIGLRHTRLRLAVGVPQQALRFQEAWRRLGDDPSDADVERLLCAMRVGEESLASESGSPLLTYVVRSASALAFDAVLAPSSGIRLPRSVGRALRWGRRPIVGYVGQRLMQRFNRGVAPGTYTCRAAPAAATPTG